MGWFTKKTKRKHARRRGQRLGVEGLERRELLAGDVVVDLMPTGDLQVTGDRLDNQIAIYQEDGQIDISGIGDTNIIFNGETSSSASVQSSDVTGSVEVNTGRGNDYVSTSGLHVNEDFNLKLGSGSDAALFRNTSVSQELDVNAGASSHSDYVHLDESSVGGDTTIQLGNADRDDGEKTGRPRRSGDSLDIQDSTITGNLTVSGNARQQSVYLGYSNVEQNASFKLGNGDDSWSAYYSSFDGENLIVTSGGDDKVWGYGVNFDGATSVLSGNGADRTYFGYGSFNSPLTVVTGNGDDSFTSYETNYDQLTIVGSNGADEFHSYYDSVDGNLTVLGGNGNDVFDVQSSSFDSSATVDMGRGQDQVNIEDVYADGDLRIFTGRGDDYVSVDSSSFQGEFLAILGSGADQFYTDMDVSFNAPALVHGSRGDDLFMFDGDEEDMDSLGVTVLSMDIEYGGVENE